MGSDVGQIFPTASLHRDHSISYALVCEKRFSIPGKNLRYPYPVCKKTRWMPMRLSNYGLYFAKDQIISLLVNVS